MNIIQVVEKLDIGGLEKIVLELSNKFSEEHNVLIITLQDYDKNKIENWILPNKNIRIISLFKNTISQNKINRLYEILKMILKMRKIIKKFNTDIIHTHHLGPLFYTTFSSIFKNVKIIHTEHDIWYMKNKKSAFIRKILFYVKKHQTVALTNQMEIEIQKNLKTKKTKTIFNGIDLDSFKYIENAKEQIKIYNKFVIGSCGRIEDVKNHIYLIEQAKKNKDIIFLIAGDGSLLEELKNKAPKNVIFLGHQNNLSLFFSAIDVFCLPSKNEGLPLSILEAYYYNKPVYTTNVGSIKEILCNENYFINTDNDLDIKEMKKLKKIEMKKTIENSFSLKNMSKQYLLTYEE